MKDIFSDISVKTLKNAINLRAKIEVLQDQLNKVLGGNGGAGTVPAPFTKGRRKMSAAGRKRIALAQKKRWAKLKGKSGGKKKGGMSAAGRAAISSAAKARWAKAKAAGKTSL